MRGLENVLKLALKDWLTGNLISDFVTGQIVDLDFWIWFDGISSPNFGLDSLTSLCLCGLIKHRHVKKPHPLEYGLLLFDFYASGVVPQV